MSDIHISIIYQNHVWCFSELCFVLKEVTPQKNVGFETHLVGGWTNPFQTYYIVKLDHFTKVRAKNSRNKNTKDPWDWSLRIQICPEKGITPIFLFWGWDWDHQSYSREGSGSLGGMFTYIKPVKINHSCRYIYKSHGSYGKQKKPPPSHWLQNSSFQRFGSSEKTPHLATSGYLHL